MSHRPINKFGLPSLPSLSSKKTFERGGGGFINPMASQFLLEKLKTPKKNMDLNSKLKFNNRVYNHFLKMTSPRNLSPRMNMMPNSEILRLAHLEKSMHGSSVMSLSPSSKTMESKEAVQLKELIDACNKDRGKTIGKISKKMENLQAELGVQLLEQKFKQLKAT